MNVSECEKSLKGNNSYEIIEKLIKKRNLGDGRFGTEDDKVNSRLVEKIYSPMIVRKYNIVNLWPVYVGMICDYSLDDLDFVVNNVYKCCDEAGIITNSIQNMRNFTGLLNETIIKYYNSKKENCVEGVIVFMYVDKLALSSASGDFLNHTKCAEEFYFILNTLPHI